MYIFATTETCLSIQIIVANGKTERKEMERKGDFFEAYKGSEKSVIAQAKRDLIWIPDVPTRIEPYRVRVARKVLRDFGVYGS